MENPLVFLTRTNYLSSGIFGQLSYNNKVLYSGEHAYEQPDGTWKPKIAPGRYTCVKRWSDKHKIDLFWIDNVPPFLGHEVNSCEIHIGNIPQKDSDGCILIGTEIDGSFLCSSKEAFIEFMADMVDTSAITLVIQ